MSTPVVVTAYFRPAPGQHDQVVEALQRAIPAVHEEPGCELYAIHDAPDGTIVMQPKLSPGCQTPVKDGTVVVSNRFVLASTRPYGSTIPLIPVLAARIR